MFRQNYISIHALLAESDSVGVNSMLTLIQFLSTLSLRRATDTSKDVIKTTTNFYPRSPCGERPHPIGIFVCVIKISIHALLAESDPGKVSSVLPGFAFLSTLSLRRATLKKSPLMCFTRHFYPRSPCGERRWLRCWQLAARDISIHALLAESDT